MAIKGSKGKRATRSGGRKAKPVIRNTSGAELLDRFRDFVLKSSDVQEDLRSIKTARGAAKLASKYGFQISERNVRAAMKVSGGPLSLDDLAGLISGAPCWCKKSVVNSKSCK